MKSAAHAWPGPFAMFRFDSFRFVPLLAKSLAGSLWLIYAFPLAMPYLVALSTVIAVLRQKV